MLKAQIEAFAMQSTSGALWLYSPAFDASISDIGTALLSGATLFVRPRDYISTLAVLASTNRNDETFYETDDASSECRVFGGYAQSKWAAEQLVRRAPKQSPHPVRIHRLGLLVGNFADSDWLSSTLRGLVRVGAYPADLDPELAFDVTQFSMQHAHATPSTTRPQAPFMCAP